jgi:hypothetical protein
MKGPGPAEVAYDKDVLHRFGYAQQLLRDMGGFSNFAISFSIISILTGAVLKEGTGLTLIGLAVGTALSIGVAMLMRGVLYGVTPTDPQTYGGVFALLGCVSLIACYLPARRAARVDPVQALRQE